MNTGNKLQWIVGMAAGTLALVLATGCQSQQGGAVVMHGEDFPAADAVRPAHEFVDMEAANAARADGTLRKYHFDGVDLNSLGEERVELMLKNGDSINPLTIYLDLKEEDSVTQQRRQTVLAFLKDHGLNDDQIKFKYGYNPDSTSPVAPLFPNGAPTSGGAAAAPASGGAAAPMAALH